jgi:signal transduction histidine kinase
LFIGSEVRLELQDEGVGYSAGVIEENGAGAALLGVGIPGMRERARQLGGGMEIYPSDSGTTVRVTLPLRSRM